MTISGFIYLFCNSLLGREMLAGPASLISRRVEGPQRGNLMFKLCLRVRRGPSVSHLGHAHSFRPIALAGDHYLNIPARGRIPPCDWPVPRPAPRALPPRPSEPRSAARDSHCGRRNIMDLRLAGRRALVTGAGKGGPGEVAGGGQGGRRWVPSLIRAPRRHRSQYCQGVTRGWRPSGGREPDPGRPGQPGPRGRRRLSRPRGSSGELRAAQQGQTGAGRWGSSKDS